MVQKVHQLLFPKLETLKIATCITRTITDSQYLINCFAKHLSNKFIQQKIVFVDVAT